LAICLTRSIHHSFQVEFDDGDVRDKVEQHEFVPEENSGEEEEEGQPSMKKKAKLSRSSPGKGHSKKQSNRSKGARKEAVSAFSSHKEVWSGGPDDDLEGGWPEGWTKKKFERARGVSKGRPDSFWFSPVEKKKFRSMNEVRRFLKELEKSEGDEEKAWKLFK